MYLIISDLSHVKFLVFIYKTIKTDKNNTIDQCSKA